MLLFLCAISCTRSPIEDNWQYGPITQVKDVFTSTFIVEYDAGIVLIDSGFNEKAKPIFTHLETLDHRSADDVQAIFFTHGHSDHMNGTSMFPNATTYALAEEKELIEEEGGRLDEELQDGDIKYFGDVTIEVISVVGHTLGNAVYIVNDVLIMGDSAQARKDGTIEPVADKYSLNPALAATSLQDLGTYLEPRKNDISWTAFSHSGPRLGIEDLVSYQAP